MSSFVSNIKVSDATANAIKSVKIDKALAPVADFKLADGSKVAEKAAALRESLLAKQDKQVVPRSRRDLGAYLADNIIRMAPKISANISANVRWTPRL